MTKLTSYIAIVLAFSAGHSNLAAAQIPAGSFTITPHEAFVAFTKASHGAFFADKFHCANMAAVVENQPDSEARRFEADIRKVVGDLQRAAPGLTYTEALFGIKRTCDERLMIDAAGSDGGAAVVER